ncbi:VARV B22R-like protein [Tanapox virus]|uniref:VARV B22R-like protein n=1 Tax=Tanapox virus TaxID=99000 RepID=A7XCS2_9POXV|nr:VARV B22R-like protein [Tanapox virus]
MMRLSFVIYIFLPIIYSKEECYRKAGLYSFYDVANTRYKEKISIFEDNFQTTQHFDVLTNSEARIMESKINWTFMSQTLTKLFNNKCNSENNYIYGGVLTKRLDFKINLTLYDIKNNYVNVTFNEYETYINFLNVTINITNECYGISYIYTDSQLNNDTLTITLTSKPVSLFPPFTKANDLGTCIIYPQTFNNSYDVITLKILGNVTYNETYSNNFNNSSYQKYVLNNTVVNNLEVFTNLTSKCTNITETMIYACGVPKEFNDTLINMSVVPNIDSNNYFSCKMLNNSADCGVSIFLDAATETIVSENNKKETSNRHKRSIDVLNYDSFCIHKNYGLDNQEDCSLPKINPVAYKNTNVKGKKRRSLEKNKPPVPSKGNLLLLSAEEMGARPKIPTRTQNVQLGASGYDGTVTGLNNIYQNVKDTITNKLKTLIIKDNKILTYDNLPKHTKLLTKDIISSKYITSSEADYIARQLIKNKKDVSYSPLNKNIVIERKNKPKGMLNIDSSSGIYANSKENVAITPSSSNVNVFKEDYVFDNTYDDIGNKINDNAFKSREEEILEAKRKIRNRFDPFYAQMFTQRTESTSSTWSDSSVSSTYFSKSKQPSTSSSTYYLKENPSLSSSSTYFLKNSPTGSGTFSYDKEHIYEEIKEPIYYKLGHPNVIDRKNIPLPPVPNSPPFNYKKQKMIDIICATSKNSICDVRNPIYNSLKFEKGNDNMIIKDNPLYEKIDYGVVNLRDGYNPLYDKRGTYVIKDNPLYEKIDYGVVNLRDGYNPLYDKRGTYVIKDNPLYEPLNNNKLTRKNAIRRKMLRPNDKNQIVLPFNNNNNNNNNKIGIGNANANINTDNKEIKLGKLTESSKINNIISTVALTAYMSSSHSKISSIVAQSGSQPKEQTIVNLISSALSQIGGTLAITGSSNAAIAGLAIQGIAGLIDVATSIYFLLSGEGPPVDPAIEKFSNYAAYVSKTEAGSRICMMPDSDITITLAYRHSEMNNDAEKTRGEYTDIIPSMIYYLKNSQISYNVKVKLICPIGQLRLFEADVNAYAKLIREDEKGVKTYIVHGILELLSYHSNVTFTCGNEPGAIFMPFEQDISDMQLLRISTPGEPESAKDMPSNVCDMYPLKKFYVLAGNCPFDMSRKSVAYVTCGTLLRMSTYEPKKQRWVLMNPFSRYENDNIQLFTFKKYDFKSSYIDLNNIGHGDVICSQTDSSTCYWSDSMILEDVTACASRIRKIYVDMSTITGKGYNSFVLTCPYGSTPFYISNETIINIPMNTRRTSVRFASQKEATAIVSCVHNSNPSYKSDIIQVNFRFSNLSSSYLNFKYFKDRKYLFDLFSNVMPKRSITCKRVSENSNCKNYYYIDNIPEIDYKVVVTKLPTVRLTTSYSGDLNAEALQKINFYYSSPFTVSIDADSLSDVYKNPDHFWKFAVEKKRTFSSISVTMFACSVVAGNINVNFGVTQSNDIFGKSGKYVYIGSKDSYDEKRITFNFVNDKDDYKLKNVFGKCSVYLDLDSRELKISCPELTVPKNPFSSENVNSMCFLIATSRDHCALSEEKWSKRDRTNDLGYSYEESQTDFDSCTSKGTSTPSDNFCYYWYAGIYWPPDYDPCSSSMILGYAPVFLEDRIVNPPYIKEFSFNPNKNEYVKRSLYEKLQNLYNQYNKLVLYSENPVVEMTNSLAKYMTSEGREIFRLFANSDEMQKAKAKNEEQANVVRKEIEETISTIYLDTLSYNDISSLLSSAISTRCCVLDKKSVYKYFKLESYLCGNYSNYLVTLNNINYLKVNNSLIEEDVYLMLGTPIITCYEISFIPVQSLDEQTIFESEIVKSAFEDAIKDIFDDYDRNISINLSKFVISLNNNNKIINNTIAVLTSFAVTVIIILISTIIINSKKKKYKVSYFEKQIQFYKQ